VHDAQQCRLDRLRRLVAEQALRSRRVRRDSKALRAAASAVVDQSTALRMVAKGITRDPTPPIPTHPPVE
jgi:hypothetical protein